MRKAMKKRIACAAVVAAALFTLSACVSGTETGDASAWLSTLADASVWLSVLGGVGITLLIAVVSVLVGLSAGAALFILDYYGNRVVRAVMPRVSNLFSLLPVLTWLVICHYLIFPVGKTGLGAALLGLSVTFTVKVYDTLRSCCEAVPAGQTDAAVAMGYDKKGTLFRILLPQILPRFLDAISQCMVLHVQDSTLVGYIAVNDLQAVTDAIADRTGAPFWPMMITAVLYIGMNLLIRLGVGALRKRFFPNSLNADQLKRRALRKETK